MEIVIDTQRKTFRNTNTVNYNFKDIIKNKDHNLNVLVGEETINKKSSLNDDRLSFFPVSFTASQAWALSSQGTPYSVDKYTNADDNLLSYFGRVNYDFQSKYLIEPSSRTGRPYGRSLVGGNIVITCGTIRKTYFQIIKPILGLLHELF